VGRPENLIAELTRWRDKAVKRGKVTTFNSDIIPDWLSAEIVAAQEAVGPEAAFSFLKQVPLSVRMAAERRIRNKVQEALEKYKRRAAQAVRRGEQFDYDGMADELRAAVLPELRELVLDNTLRLSVDTGITFDPAILNTEALRWAREYSYDLVRGLTETTRSQIAEAISAFVGTPGMTIGDIEALIEPSFGRVRADMISVTEVTRAYSRATNELTDMLRTQTPEMVITRVNNTMNDELVCQICGPLEGAPESEWPSQDGPPWHPNCRCGTSIRFETPEQLAEQFGARQAEREAWLRERGLWKEPAGAEVQPLSYMPSRDQVQKVLTYVDQRLAQYASQRGLSVDQVKADILTRLEADLKAPVSIRSGQLQAESILTDGRFKTQFEVGRSSGAFAPELRTKAERLGLGIPDNVDSAQRPIYAYFKAGRPQVSNYGGVEFELVDNVKDRATYTLGDSLMRFDSDQLAGSPISNPGLEGVGGGGAEYLDFGADGIQYIEAQIQGGVSVKDVNRIIIHSNSPEYNWIIAEARRQGIEVVIDASTW